MRLQPKRSFKAGLTIVEVLLICGVLAALSFWLIARMMPPPNAKKINCANNLKQTGFAFKTWALDNGDRFPMKVPPAGGGTQGLTNAGQLFTHFMVMSNELSTPWTLACPQDRRRKAAPNFWPALSDANISYFLNLDATEDSPGGELMSGDANLTNTVSAGLKIVLMSTNQSVGWSKAVHGRRGNLLFSDGSVSQFSNGGVSAVVLHNSAIARDRLLMP